MKLRKTQSGMYSTPVAGRRLRLLDVSLPCRLSLSNWPVFPVRQGSHLLPLLPLLIAESKEHSKRSMTINDGRMSRATYTSAKGPEQIQTTSSFAALDPDLPAPPSRGCVCACAYSYSFPYDIEPSIPTLDRAGLLHLFGACTIL
jgi:hypothetical protein